MSGVIAAGISANLYNLSFYPLHSWLWQHLVRSASRSCLISFSISRAFFSVAIWLTLAWIWIPCWFCNYKSRYAEDERDFIDYFLECLKLQLKIMVAGPVLLACTFRPSFRLRCYVRTFSRAFLNIFTSWPACRRHLHSSRHPLPPAHADLRNVSMVRVLLKQLLRLLRRLPAHVLEQP